MTTDHLPRIAIVGGGAAGWMAAAALANAYDGRGGRITLVDIPQAPSTEIGDAAIPTMRTFNEKLGIPEDSFIRETQATFKLGTAFMDWSAPGQAFLHPFGHYGTAIETVGFHHCWLKMRALGDASDLADYSLAAVAASAGRFMRPVVDTNSVLSSYSYGFHFDASRYLAELRAYALARGVICKASHAVAARLRASDGFIEGLALDQGERVDADLYIDCSGAAGVLIEQALRTGYEDWSQWLPCDRVVSCRSERANDGRPLAWITAREAGWQWRIPLQGRTSHGYVYSSRFLGDDEARTALTAGVNTATLDEPALARFVNGRRKKFWNRNCVALGPAAGFLEPLEATGVHLIQSGISRLLQLLPAEAVEAADADEYNRLTAAEYEQIRDFLILHYHASGYPDAALWDYCRAMAIPETLARRMEMYKSRGRVSAHLGDVFLLPNWLAIFTGLNVRPRRYHPFADGLGIEMLRRQMLLIRAAVREAAETMPSHASVVAQSAARTK